jgi:hypothetical protein
MKKFTWLPLVLLTLTIINYPNPFNPRAGETATFECTPDATAEAQLMIYDLAARLVIRHPVSLRGGVVNRTSWNGYNNDNELAGTGVYLYRLVDAVSKTTLGKGKVWVINK